MAIIRWNPFQELADVRREMQSLASLMPRFVPFAGEERFVPALDCTSRGDDLVCRVEIPGMDIEKDVDVTVEQGLLRVSGQRQAEAEEERGGVHIREMRYGSFERTLPLPETVTPEDVRADYRDGILEIVVAGGAKQIPPMEARRIAINRGGQQGMGQGAQQVEIESATTTGGEQGAMGQQQGMQQQAQQQMQEQQQGEAGTGGGGAGGVTAGGMAGGQPSGTGDQQQSMDQSRPMSPQQFGPGQTQWDQTGQMAEQGGSQQSQQGMGQQADRQGQVTGEEQQSWGEQQQWGQEPREWAGGTQQSQTPQQGEQPGAQETAGQQQGDYAQEQAQQAQQAWQSAEGQEDRKDDWDKAGG